MNKKLYITVLLMTCLIMLSACGKKEEDMTIEDVALESTKEDQKILDEAEKFIKDGDLKDEKFKSYSDYMISVFNQTSDKHIVYNGIGYQLIDLSIEALSRDLKDETKDYKYIARKEMKLLDRLKAGRQSNRLNTDKVESIYNMDNSGEFISKISKLDRQYEGYREAKGLEE